MTEKTKRPRIAREPKERSFRPDMSAWDIIIPMKLRAARAEAEALGDVFEVPFKNDRERIKYYSGKYAQSSVTDAFNDVYGLNLTGSEKADFIPGSLRVGDVLELNILSISRDGTVFDPGNYKTNFITRNNLSKYAIFSEYTPVKPVPCRVIETKSNHTVVDVLGALAESFIIPRAAEPWRQYTLIDYKPIRVKNLHLVGGGYIGEAVIPNVSTWVGEEYTVPAFIPGSQIVQNTTDNFEQFEGTDVDTFIISYSPKPNGQGMSLICSAKSLIKHRGNILLRQLHSLWCDDGPEWKEFAAQSFTGIVTGVINSSKKCGVFIEVPELEFTGMIDVPADKLVEYHPGEQFPVRFTGFEEEMYWNDAVGQYQRLQPFEIVDGCIKAVNIKPILDFGL